MKVRHFLITAAALLTATGCSKPTSTNPERKPPPPYIVETVIIATEPFSESLAATGTLLANESVEIQTERAGLVTEIFFTEGQSVKGGELLLKTDDSELRAELARAEARLALQVANEERQASLLGQRNISRADYDESRANLDIARAEVALTQAQLAKTEIRAPFDGVPGIRGVSVGMLLSPGMPVTSFSDVSSLKLDFSVPERYLPNLSLGQRVEFQVAGQRGVQTGEIYVIEPGVDQSSRSVRARARVPNPDGTLAPGQFAEILVVMEPDPEAILIPSIALIPGLKDSRVLLFKDGNVVEQVVRTGLRTAGKIQVIEGLEPGDRVITTGVLQIRPGMAVEARDVAENVETQN